MLRFGSSCYSGRVSFFLFLCFLQCRSGLLLLLPAPTFATVSAAALRPRAPVRLLQRASRACRSKHFATGLEQHRGCQRCPDLARVPARKWAPLPLGKRVPAAAGVSRRIWLGDTRGCRSSGLSDRGAGSVSDGSRMGQACGAGLRPAVQHIVSSPAACSSGATFSHALLRCARCFHRPQLHIACMLAPPCLPLRCRSF